MYVGIEIGGTKLQLGVGDGASAEIVALQRFHVDADRGAGGILEEIQRCLPALQRRFDIQRVGIGFGGPVDNARGRTLKSHQIDGWEDMPLAKWFLDNFQVPAVVGNDCDVAALAEARFGAGQGFQSLFYVTVGTGIGGGFVTGGRLYGASRPAVAEIGHLRPGLHADHPEETVESLASGSGIATAAQLRIAGDVSRITERNAGDVHREYKKDLLLRAGGELGDITAKIIAQAANEGNELAVDVLASALRALGWAIAQVVTLLAPEIIVVGGGVSLIGDELFLQPLKDQVAKYVFPPLAESYTILPAALGENVVVNGALALAASG